MDRDEKIRIANDMITFGGGFASNLGRALLVADTQNTLKILDTWPELLEEYRTFTIKP